MNKKSALLVSLIVFTLCAGAPVALAEDDPAAAITTPQMIPPHKPDRTIPRNRDYLGFSIGYYDINDNEETIDLRVEYRWDKKLLWEIKPWIGAEITGDGALYGLGGLRADFYVTDNVLITPSFGVGLYGDGDGKDLGHSIEFRSQLEVSYELENGVRLGLAGSHISNCHLDNDNPGTEVISLYYHTPASHLFK